MISHEHQLIFIHYPRTGGTPLEMLLTDVDQLPTGLKHIPAKEASQRYQRWWHTYTKVTFIRHPADLVASYAVWSPYADPHVRDSVRRFLGGRTIGDYTGNPWDRSLVGQRKNLGTLYNPETWITLRFETLAEDYRSLGRILGVPLELPERPTMPTLERKGRTYQEILGEECLRAVEEILGEDYRAFGYPTEYD